MDKLQQLVSVTPLVIAFIMGIIFIDIPIGMLLGRRIKRLRCTDSAVGTVVHLVSQKNPSEPVCYSRSTAPVITFMAGPNEYHVQGLVYTNPPAYRVGDRVVVCYNPDDPEDFYLEHDTPYVLCCVIFGAVGILLLGATLALALLYLSGII